MGAASTAAESFERTLVEIGLGDDRIDDPAALGRRAALLAAGDVVWTERLGPFYSTKQVREVMGIGSRQAISERVKRRRLLALQGPDGTPRFPAFQFGQDGRLLPGFGAILDVFAGAVESPYTTASWFVTPETLLAGKAPARWLRDGGDPERAVTAASRYAERLRR
jgi:hypothetical protein